MAYKVLYGNILWLHPSYNFMKVYNLFTVFAIALFSCKNSKQPDKTQSFKQFDFSYNDFFTTCFSIKFTRGDTVFMRQHFAPFADTLKSDENYFAILNEAERQKLDSFLNRMNFTTYDTSYYESFEDGEYYQFYIVNDSMQKTVFIHSDSIPIELKEFGYWIVSIKKNLQYHLADTTAEYGSLKYFLPPEALPPPTIDFKPPKVE